MPLRTPHTPDVCRTVCPSRARGAVVAAMVAAVVGHLLGGCASGPGRVPTAVSPQGNVQGNAQGNAPAAQWPSRDGPPPQGAPSLAELASQPDPVPQVEPIRPGGPNKPYSVLGQSYAPLADDVPWVERGAASWYGQKFHGRRTASGEVYSMYGLTAAHRTLPIPSYVRVRNVRNGKDIIVRVNDRGPFHAKRILDLSYAAAVKLDMLASGTGEVEISRLTFDDIRAGVWQRGTVLDPDQATASTVPLSAIQAASPTVTPATTATVVPPSPTSGDDPLGELALRVASRPPMVTPASIDASGPAADAAPDPAQASGSSVAEPTKAAARAFTPAAKGFWVQLASLSRHDGVDRLQRRIGQQLDGLLPMLAVFHEPPLFKLQVGPYASRAEAQQAAAQARRTLQLEPMVLERR